MNIEPIKNNLSEFGPGEEKISRLLSGMKRVEAPKDFDFKVRARIAAGRPAERFAFGIPAAVRYAVPLVLLILIGVYFGFNALYSNRQIDVPVVADSRPSVVAPQPMTPLNETAVAPAPPVVPLNPVNNDRAAVKKTQIPNTGVVETKIKKSVDVNKSSSESYVDASREAKTLDQRSVNTNSRASANTNVVNTAMQSRAGQVLALFGISGTLEKGGWRVSSVGPNTLAGRSGVKAGDLIETINDQPIDKIASNGKFDAKSLGVRRGSQTIQITLKN